MRNGDEGEAATLERPKATAATACADFAEPDRERKQNERPLAAHQQHGGDGDRSDGDVELMSRSTSEC